MSLSDKLLPVFLSAAETALEAVQAWRDGEYGVPKVDAGIYLNEIVFKEGTDIPFRMLQLVVHLPSGTSAQYTLEGVIGSMPVLSMTGFTLARGAIYTWAATAAEQTAKKIVDSVRMAISAGLEKDFLDDVWNEAVVREVLIS